MPPIIERLSTGAAPIARPWGICYKPATIALMGEGVPNRDANPPGGTWMNKAQLINRVARDTRITKVQAARVIDSLLEHITKALKKGERASLVGFGTFTVARRRARTGRNPQTGSPIKIPARRGVRFAARKSLKSEGV